MSWAKGNLAEADGFEHPQTGHAFLFGESRPFEIFRDVGVNVRVLQPGQPASVYHAEAAEEFFIVLGGECLAIVEEEEIPLRQWEFLYCPPDTAHLIVGAGESAATVLMIGGRRAGSALRYPVSSLAARYGASVETETSDPHDAWGQVGFQMDFEAARLPWPPA